MTLSELIENALNEERKQGMKQREIAKAHNVSRSYIQSLLTGRCPYDGITLDSFTRMFPNATIYLNGDKEKTQAGNASKKNLLVQIEEALRQQQRQGRTQTEMSELNGISQSHIQRILANPGKKIRGLKVETIMKMFPHATLSFIDDEVKNNALETKSKTLAEQFKDFLFKEQENGKSQVEIASEHGVSQQYISSLLSPNHNCEGVSLGIVSTMFPHASLNFNENEDWRHPASAEHIRARIIAAIIPLDIPPESLQAVLRAINELNLE